MLKHMHHVLVVAWPMVRFFPKLLVSCKMSPFRLSFLFAKLALLARCYQLGIRDSGIDSSSCFTSSEDSNRDRDCQPRKVGKTGQECFLANLSSTHIKYKPTHHQRHFQATLKTKTLLNNFGLSSQQSN